jgi:hypothetical protein
VTYQLYYTFCVIYAKTRGFKDKKQAILVFSRFLNILYCAVDIILTTYVEMSLVANMKKGGKIQCYEVCVLKFQHHRCVARL